MFRATQKNYNESWWYFATKIIIISAQGFIVCAKEWRWVKRAIFDLLEPWRKKATLFNQSALNPEFRLKTSAWNRLKPLMGKGSVRYCLFSLLVDSVLLQTPPRLIWRFTRTIVDQGGEFFIPPVFLKFRKILPSSTKSIFWWGISPFWKSAV